MIGLSAEVRICKKLCQETNGWYSALSYMTACTYSSRASDFVSRYCWLDLVSVSGAYNVILDESHFKDLLTEFVPPPQVVVRFEIAHSRRSVSDYWIFLFSCIFFQDDVESSLVKMGKFLVCCTCKSFHVSSDWLDFCHCFDCFILTGFPHDQPSNDSGTDFNKQALCSW